MKQTAIQLLMESIDYEMKLGTKMVVNWERYLEMEKEQIMDAYTAGESDGDHYEDSYLRYYNETFNTNEK
jgi:hypothetical protein